MRGPHAPGRALDAVDIMGIRSYFLRDRVRAATISPAPARDKDARGADPKRERPVTGKFIPLAKDFYVAPQITPSDVADAAAEGFTLIVNNRPDGEGPGQPAGADIERAALAAGLAYVHIPVDGRGLSQDHISALKSAIKASGKKTLAFCRSGTRSAIVRSYMKAADGGDADAIIAEAAAAGYDISGHRPALEALKAGSQAKEEDADE